MTPIVANKISIIAGKERNDTRNIVSQPKWFESPFDHHPAGNLLVLLGKISAEALDGTIE